MVHFDTTLISHLPGTSIDTLSDPDSTMDDIELISDELRHINVDLVRHQPLRLDKMFLRATEWRAASEASSSVKRAPSPPRPAATYPLPKPCNDGVSPLAGLFDYPELIPHVLKWFERPAELGILARVNRTFCDIVRKKLYGHIWIRPCEWIIPPELSAWRCPV